MSWLEIDAASAVVAFLAAPTPFRGFGDERARRPGWMAGAVGAACVLCGAAGAAGVVAQAAGPLAGSLGRIATQFERLLAGLEADLRREPTEMTNL